MKRRRAKANPDFETYDGYPVGKNQKGLVDYDGGLVSWDVDPKTGNPHHDEVSEDLRLTLTNFNGKYLHISGRVDSIDSASDILNFFNDYSGSSEISIELWTRFSDKFFIFGGTVNEMKAFFKHSPPPYPEDYEDADKDDEFLEDYDNWIDSAVEKTSARQILGRGGPDDPWQDKDEDWSKSFSVYNNPGRKKKR